MNKPDDEDHLLMERIARRDAAAFRMLADRHMSRALSFMERMLGNRAQAEDMVQEAFEIVWRQAPQWKPLAKFSTWFYGILGNLARRRFRDRLRDHAALDEETPDSAATPEETAARGEGDHAVKAALQALPERQRLALVLFYYEELSQQEACTVMGIREGAFESLLSRGRAQLKQKLSRTHLH